jgi:WD40 repeat protein
MALDHEEEIASACFSADGHKVAIGGDDGRVIVWDAVSGSALTPPFGHGRRVNSICFSADGAKLVTAGNDGAAAIWDAATGRRLAPPLPHSGGVWFAEFNPAGDKVVTASLDYTAKLWTAAGDPIRTLQHRAPVEDAGFSPDGLRLATAAGDTARLWNATTGAQLTEPLQHADLVRSVRFSPDGRRVLTASMDGTAQLWDAETGLKLADPFQHGGEVTSVNFSGDGRRAITASSDKTAAIWDVPIAPNPIPEWLPDLAEAVGGRRLDPDRNLLPVTWAEYTGLKSRLAGLPPTDPLAAIARKLFDD